MGIDIEQLRRLEQLQDIDLEILRSEKALAELPERKRIYELRLKKEKVLEKKSKIQILKKNSDEELEKINNEEESLDAKQSSIQKKIDDMKGDYRLVESYSKDLAGIAKRRNALETQVGKLEDTYSKIEGTEKQVSEALSLIEEQEENEIRSFREKGGALQNTISQRKESRASVVAYIEPSLLEEYEKISNLSGGIALSHLTNRSCSVCRSTFSDGKLLQVLSEAPLSRCPSCRRLMVVEHD